MSRVFLEYSGHFFECNTKEAGMAMKQEKHSRNGLFKNKIMVGILIAGTTLSLLMTILSFSVACIWGGDEAVGLVHMTELVFAAVCQEDVEVVGETLLAEEQDNIGETGKTDQEGFEEKENGQKNTDERVEEPEASEIVLEETEEEREARELEERIAKADYPFYIKVNRQQCCITVYAVDEEGSYTIPYKAMICSTGLYNRTPAGTFQISDKYVWRDLNGGVCGQYASRVYRGVLFHSVPYYSHSKNALCSSKYNKLGEQASAGCIRLTVADAKWIYDNCPSGTTVEIYDDEDPGPLGKPEAVKIDLESPNKGWDPTDPDEANPWKEEAETTEGIE